MNRNANIANTVPVNAYKINYLNTGKTLASDLQISLCKNKGGEVFMGSAAIKVIKKNSRDIQPAPSEPKNVKNYSKKAINRIEDNIKGWIEEFEVRKNDELIQAHSFLGGF